MAKSVYVVLGRLLVSSVCRREFKRLLTGEEELMLESDISSLSPPLVDVFIHFLNLYVPLIRDSMVEEVRKYTPRTRSEIKYHRELMSPFNLPNYIIDDDSPKRLKTGATVPHLYFEALDGLLLEAPDAGITHILYAAMIVNPYSGETSYWSAPL